MGLTVRCAECHSHKYDPVSHREYYQLLDFFNQTADSDKRDDRPKLEFLLKEQRTFNEQLEEKIAALELEVKGKPDVWTVRTPTKTDSREGTRFKVQEDKSILATGPSPAYEEYRLTFKFPAGKEVNGLRIELLPHKNFSGNLGRIGDGAFIISQFRVGVKEGEKERLLPLSDAAADFSQPGRNVITTIKPEIDGKRNDQGWAVKHPKLAYRGRREAILSLKEPFIPTEDAEVTLYIYCMIQNGPVLMWAVFVLRQRQSRILPRSTAPVRLIRSLRKLHG